MRAADATGLNQSALTQDENLRIENLLAILPRGRVTILEIGARRGLITRRLIEYFDSVTALDLEQPQFEIDRVIRVKGDVQDLDFPDNSFDCVLCSEVLEHVPDISSAVREIARVARHEVIVGVPYRQDTRVGRTRCGRCHKVSPPYGHIHRFDENSLQHLFRGLTVAALHYVGNNRERTNAVSAWLEDLAGNPSGSYEQEEPCIHCGGKLARPEPPALLRRLCAAAGWRLYEIQKTINRQRPTWVHAVFQKL
jgi:SAM-dependent methyltransferase